MFLKLLIKAKKIPAKESMCCINQDITNILLFRINTYLLKQDVFNTPKKNFHYHFIYTNKHSFLQILFD